MKDYLRSFATGEAVRQFLKVGVIGVLNTVTFFVIFNILRSTTDMNRPLAVSIAFAVATLLSYVLNRRWTFKLKDGNVVLRETVIFYAVNLLAWAVTVAVVESADAVFGPLDRLGENIALIVAAGLILLPKFASYRDVVFRRALRGSEDGSEKPPSAAEPSLTGQQPSDRP
jgi:putative flippase GtrA